IGQRNGKLCKAIQPKLTPMGRNYVYARRNYLPIRTAKQQHIAFEANGYSVCQTLGKPDIGTLPSSFPQQPNFIECLSNLIQAPSENQRISARSHKRARPLCRQVDVFV